MLIEQIHSNYFCFVRKELSFTNVSKETATMLLYREIGSDAIDGASDLDAFIVLHNDTYKEDKTVDVVARVNRWTADTNVKAYRR